MNLTELIARLTELQQQRPDLADAPVHLLTEQHEIGKAITGVSFYALMTPAERTEDPMALDNEILEAAELIKAIVIG